MSAVFLLLSYAALAATVFAAFGMQRTTLLLARQAQLPPKELAVLLLPRWFPLVSVARFAKWACFIGIGLYLSWPIAAAALAIDLACAAILPIPHQLHLRIFRKRAEILRSLLDPETAEILLELLSRSRFSARQ